MSLILDALRKAESERQRGAVPGLHGVTAPPTPEPAAGSRPSGLTPLRGALGALGLVMVAALVGWLARPSAVPLLPEAAAPSLPAAAAPTLPAAALPAAEPAPLPLVVSAPPVQPDKPLAVPAPLPAAPGTTTAAPPPPLPAASRAPIVTQVRRLADLPPEQRRELPALAVSGSVWSDQPGARFVVLDGQVLREGDRLAPGLVLVKLAPRSATLRWRDGLIEVPF
jgi:general secretion pathway protein B